MAEWIEDGTLPSASFADFRVIDLRKLHAALLSEKDVQNAEIRIRYNHHPVALKA
ncbi:hypothetical protein ACSVIJ_12825 [Pseudomonas sp. NCHU5208]|uniref:hypothetical protein n=1 Tax=unclassified Pseudomonas TaxID=196821 RepID=UPI003F9BF885